MHFSQFFLIPISRFYLIICHSRCTIVLCVRVFYYVPSRRRRKRTRSRDSKLLFFSSLCISLSDRSRKVGAKNRQLPNERQLSGDQLQEGPDRRIRCNRPMSTVQHLCLFSVSFSFQPPCNFSRGVKGEERKRRGKEERTERDAFSRFHPRH